MDWHARFLQQAGWTRALRDYLLGRAGLAEAERVLEVGCGTGAILADLATPAAVYGLDRQAVRLGEARRHAPQARPVCGDARQLPFPEASFDIVFCHYLLLWVPDPLGALLEMRRVTRPGGSVLALAEPDYTARVDEPAELKPLGTWQTDSLRRQGADPSLGARLADLFRQAGLPPVETGTLQGGGERPPEAAGRRLEWEVLTADLAGWVPEQELLGLKVLDEKAWRDGSRRLHVPTYFAWGRVGRMV